MPLRASYAASPVLTRHVSVKEDNLGLERLQGLLGFLACRREDTSHDCSGRDRL